MKCLTFIVLILLKIVHIIGVKDDFSQEFPPLYTFDDYDNCFDHKTLSSFERTYCMVYAEIQPQNSSELWRKISQHLEFQFHYKRDRLFFGVCLQRCKHFANLPENVKHNETRIDNKITNYFNAIHKRPLDLQMRLEYHDLVYSCLSLEFQKLYDLKLKTYVEYCEQKEDSVEKGKSIFYLADKIVFKMLEIILILNIISTLYDYCLKRQQPIAQQNDNFYKINPHQPVSTLLTAFSIPRNYYRLTEPCSTVLGKDLNYLDGVRSIATLMVVIGHVYFVQYQHVKNPHDFEQFAKSSTHLWFTNGTLVLEIFHVMSGMLLYIKFKEFACITPTSSMKDCFKIFTKAMVMRFVRFLPSLVLFLLVQATFFTRLQDGPYWRHITEPGRVISREKWWNILFMLDNTSEGGYPHTWYMTTDWQLFAFYFAVLIISEKYPQYKKRILATLAVLSFAIPFTVSYIFKIAPCFLISPESYRFTVVKPEDHAYYNLYIPFYTNLGGYLCGIVLGTIYERFSHNEEIYKQISRIPKALCEFVFWSCIALGLWICFLGSVVIFQESSIWTALYAGLNRNLWASVVIGIPVLMCTFCKTLSIMNVFCYSMFRILARLSFQVYVWHFPIIYLLNGYKREPVFTNHLHHATLTIGMLTLTIGLAFIIAIFYEYPCHKVVNYYYKKPNLVTKPSPKELKCR